MRKGSHQKILARSDRAAGPPAPPSGPAELDAAPRTFLEKLGFDRAYTGSDRIVAFVTLAWPLAFTAIFIAGTGYAVWRARSGDPVSDAAWSSWWHGWTWLILCTSVVIVCWFSVGGIRDLIRMYRLLERRRADWSDDGRPHSIDR